jgi:glycosyltransferase involved in cell wall biosynthesis
MGQKQNLTIIVPVYNEEESLSAFQTEMEKFVAAAPIEVVVLYVNDGSSDDSQNIINNICETNDTCQSLVLDKNYGLSTAIKAGIDNCRSSLVGYIDADLQTSPSDFVKFLDFFPEFDMVNGIRMKRQDKIVKKISSKFANSFRRMMINDNITDTCCPLKIIKTEYAQKIPFFKGMHRFIPALIQLMGGKVKQVPISHFERYAGTAKYHLWNRLIGPFFDTLAFRWMRKRNIQYTISKHST